MADELNTGIAELLARKQEKKEAAMERKKEREENGQVNKLAIERTEHGLYTVRYLGGGRIPDLLQGTFTSKFKVLDMVKMHYGNTDMVVDKA